MIDFKFYPSYNFDHFLPTLSIIIYYSSSRIISQSHESYVIPKMHTIIQKNLSLFFSSSYYYYSKISSNFNTISIQLK